MIFSHSYRFRSLRSLSHLGGGLGWGLFLLLLFSCNSLFMDEQKSNTAQNNFDLLWKIFDERYCFFEEKGVDWGLMYDKHCYNWVKKGGNDPLSSHLFHAMVQMLEELCDGHVSLDDGFNSRTYTGWYSSFPENYNANRIHIYRNDRTKYLNNETFFSTLPEGIGYLRCPSFSDKFNRDDLDKAIAQFEGLKGVIIDVRNNGGGLVSEAYLLASRFAREKTHVGYVRYKTGKGHNDFSDFFARYVEPDGAHHFHGKVVVITNRKVYSAANLFVSIMSNLPDVRTMGDCTGGGGGVPITAELYNGWSVKLSTNPTFDTSKRSIESGIEPDRHMALNKDSQNDNIIEAAKLWILAN